MPAGRADAVPTGRTCASALPDIANLKTRNASGDMVPIGAVASFNDTTARFGRALETPAHDQPDREHVRDGAAQDHPIEGLPVQQNGARHGVQAR
jgi:hypothetical protein